jgi:hypothetical protein
MTTSEISRIIEEHITAFEEAKLITPPSIQYEGFNLGIQGDGESKGT